MGSRNAGQGSVLRFFLMVSRYYLVTPSSRLGSFGHLFFGQSKLLQGTLGLVRKWLRLWHLSNDFKLVLILFSSYVVLTSIYVLDDIFLRLLLIVWKFCLGFDEKYSLKTMFVHVKYILILRDWKYALNFSKLQRWWGLKCCCTSCIPI